MRPERTAEEELLFLSARTRLEGDAPDRLQRLLDGPLDWGAILHLSVGHHTNQLLYHHLADRAPGRVPGAVLDELRTRYLHTAARNLRAVNELVSVLGELEAAGAPAVVWKGAALAHTVYPSPELRIFSDADLMVRRRDRSRVRAVLGARGYEVDRTPGASEEELLRRPGHAVVMRNPRTGIHLDVHWGPVRGYFSPAMDCERLWHRSRGLRVKGATIRVLEPESHLIVLCMHGAKHKPFPWPVLKWVTDLEAIARGYPPGRWDSLLDHARRLGCLRRLLLGLHLARELLEAPLPPGVRAAIRGDPAVAEAAAAIPPRMLAPGSVTFSFPERVSFDLAVRERLRDRIWYRAVRGLTPYRRRPEGLPFPLRLLRAPILLLRPFRRFLVGSSLSRRFIVGDRGSGNGVP